MIDRATARATGLTDVAIRYRIASSRWAQLHRGFYFTRGIEPQQPDRLAGALLAAGTDAALSGAAALAQWQVRGVLSPERPLILAPLTSGVRTTPTLRVRRTGIAFRSTIVNDLRVVDIARAVADHCVGVRRLDTVRAITSEVIRRRLCTADQLAAALAAGPRRGSANLRIAVEDASFGAWSVPEGLIGRALRAAGVPSFDQNVRIVDDHGAEIAVVDVWWEQLGAALEVLGAEDHSGPAAWKDTVRRAARLEALGVAVMQVPAIDVLQRIDQVVDRVSSWLTRLPERLSERRRFAG